MNVLDDIISVNPACAGQIPELLMSYSPANDFELLDINVCLMSNPYCEPVNYGRLEKTLTQMERESCLKYAFDKPNK